MYRVKKSKNLTAIQAARSPKDVVAVVLKIVKGIKKVSAQTDILLESLSSSKGQSVNISLSNREIIMEEGNLAGDTMPGKGTKKTALRSVIEVPELDFDQLVQDNEALNFLAQSIGEIEVAQQILRSQQFASHKTTQAAIASIDPWLQESRQKRDLQLQAMSQVRSEFKPTEHKKVINTVAKHLANPSVITEDRYSGITKRTFVMHPNGDEVWYQTYITVTDFVNTVDYAYEEYSVIVTGVLDINDGTLVHHVTSLKDSRIPGSFGIGPEIETSAKLKMRLNSLLSVDDLLSEQDRQAIKFNTSDLNKRIRGSGEIKSVYNDVAGYIKAVRAKEDKFIFTLENGMRPEDKEKIQQDLYLLVGARPKDSLFVEFSRKKHLDTMTVSYESLTAKKAKLRVKTLIKDLGIVATKDRYKYISPNISNMRVVDDSMVFRLVPGMDKTEKKELINALKPILNNTVRGNLNKSKETLQHKFFKGKGGREMLSVVVTPAFGSRKDKLTKAKIERLAEELGLNERQIRDLKAIN